MINEACEKGFFFLEKTSGDQRKKHIKPSKSFIDEFNQYLANTKKSKLLSKLIKYFTYIFYIYKKLYI
jgi:hypothetical protein